MKAFLIALLIALAPTQSRAAVMQEATSMATTITGSSFNIATYGTVAVQAVYSGSPNGTLKLQCSNDNSNWSDISGASSSVSSAGNTVFNLTDAGYAFIRLIYTFVSGSGSLSATVNGKTHSQ